MYCYIILIEPKSPKMQSDIVDLTRDDKKKLEILKIETPKLIDKIQDLLIVTKSAAILSLKLHEKQYSIEQNFKTNNPKWSLSKKEYRESNEQHTKSLYKKYRSLYDDKPHEFTDYRLLEWFDIAEKTRLYESYSKGFESYNKRLPNALNYLGRINGVLQLNGEDILKVSEVLTDKKILKFDELSQQKKDVLNAMTESDLNLNSLLITKMYEEYSKHCNERQICNGFDNNTIHIMYQLTYYITAKNKDIETATQDLIKEATDSANNNEIKTDNEIQTKINDLKTEFDKFREKYQQKTDSSKGGKCTQMKNKLHNSLSYNTKQMKKRLSRKRVTSNHSKIRKHKVKQTKYKRVR